MFAPPVQIGQLGDPDSKRDSYLEGQLGVIIADDGAATVTWVGQWNDEDTSHAGVYAAYRQAGGAWFGTPDRVSNDLAYNAKFAGNPRGDRVIGWDVPKHRSEYRGYDARIAFAPAGRAFGRPEELPAPPSVAPAGAGAPTQSLISAVGMRPDGSAVVVYSECYGEVDHGPCVGLIAIHQADGAWSDPRRSGDGIADIATDGWGGTHFLGFTFDPAVTGEQHPTLWASDLQADGSVGPKTVLSRPETWISSYWQSVHFEANRRGDLLATWVAQPWPADIGSLDTDAACRPFGGTWQVTPRVVPGGGYGELGEGGQAVVAGSAGSLEAPEVTTVFRSPAGDWSRPRSSSLPGPASGGSAAMKVDPSGSVIMAMLTDGWDTTVYRLFTASVTAVGDLPAPAELSNRAGRIEGPAMALNPRGEGLLVWYEGDAERNSGIYASTFEVEQPPAASAPPVVSKFTAHARYFTFRTTRAARVQVTVAGKSRRVGLAARARTGVNRVRFSKRVRSLLRRPGRYRATIRAHAPDGSISRPRSVMIKRR